jgi:two-component system, sporulation sensor kinase E
MKSGFFDKLIKRMDRLEPGEVQPFLAQLLREKGLLEKVFQALREGVILLDDGAKVTYVNDAACRFFGFDKERIVGQQLSGGMRGLDWAELRKPGTVVSRDLEISYPELRYLNFYVTAVDDSPGHGFVMLIRDVTESRKLTEEKIESERISALTMLAAGVAHELGNPLNSLTIHMQLLERRLKSGKALHKLQEHVDVAQTELKRLDAIITQFLAAIRPSQPQLQPTQINELLEESVRFFAPEIEQAQVNVTLDLRRDCPQLPADAGQMKQVFYNLIRNGLQAMPSGGELTVSTSYNDYELLITVVDTGKGISAESMGHLFQPFFSTRKTGTGLGLLIVRRIIREHGGEIDISSRQGEGTRVILALPLVAQRIRMLA